MAVKEIRRIASNLRTGRVPEINAKRASRIISEYVENVYQKYIETGNRKYLVACEGIVDVDEGYASLIKE